MVIRIPKGIKVAIIPETWVALVKSDEALKYHLNKIRKALKNL